MNLRGLVAWWHKNVQLEIRINRVKIRPALASLVFLITLLTACSFIGPQSETKPEKFPDAPETKKAESRLLEATLQLLRTSGENDPDSHNRARLVFEEALAEYLLATRQSRETELRITRDGKTYLLPIHILDNGVSSEKMFPADTLPLSLEAFGPDFQGEILDLARAASAGPWPDRLLILFADSLATLSWPEMIDSSRTVIRFDREYLAGIRSIFPAGMLVTQKTGLQNDSEFMLLTSSLRSALTLQQQERRFVLIDSFSTTQEPWLPNSWNIPSGQEIFRSLSGEITSFRSLRTLPDAGIVLLDEAGYLRWLSSDLQEEIWKSEHAFGDRLFLLRDDMIAICNSRQNYFWVFQREGRQMRLLGKSPTLSGYVGAIIPVQFGHRSGFFVSVMTISENSRVESQLRFLPDSLLYEQSPLHFNEPRFPHHFARLVFVPQETAGEILNHPHMELLPLIESHIYEPLFNIDSQGRIVPLLASQVWSDASGREWHIQLKEGVRFADGTLVTADDVYRSWKRNWLSGSEKNCTMQWLWKNIRGVEEFLSRKRTEIEGIRLIDSHSLVVTLKAPRPNFKEHLTQPCFQVRKSAGRGRPDLGTGPYQIQEIRNQPGLTAVHCQRNIYYHCGQPSFQEITVLFQNDRITDAFLQYRTFSAVVRQKKNIDYFKQVNITQIKPFPRSPIYFLVLNPSVSMLSDIQRRLYIVNSFLGRNILASIIHEAECEVACSFFSNHAITPGVEENHTLSFKKAITITFRASDSIARQIAERLAARLQQRYVPVNPIQPLADQDFEQTRKNHKYQILIDCFAPPFSSPLYNFCQLLNNGYITDSHITRMVENSLAAPSRYELSDLEKQLTEQVILFPLLRVQSYAVFSSELQDVALLGTQQIDFTHAWVPLKP